MSKVNSHKILVRRRRTVAQHGAERHLGEERFK